MKKCQIHEELELIYLVLNHEKSELFKCAQCIIDEGIQNTRHLLLISSVLKSDDSTIFVNWPKLQDPSILDKVVCYQRKNKQEKEQNNLKQMITHEFNSLKSSIIQYLEQEEANIHTIIDKCIYDQSEFQNLYNKFSEKDKFKEYIMNYESIDLSQQEQISKQQQQIVDFLKQKQNQIQQISSELQKIFPYKLVEFDQSNFQLIIKDINKSMCNQIQSISQKIFHKEQKKQKQQQQFKSNQDDQNKQQNKNNQEQSSIDDILSILNQDNIFIKANNHEQTKNLHQFEQKDQNQNNISQNINSINNDKNVIDNKVNHDFNQNIQKIESQIEQKQSENIEQNNIIQNLEIIKSMKGGSSTDIQAGKDKDGFPLIKYIRSGYDHSQCMLNKVLYGNKKYTFRIQLKISDPLNNQIMIGLIRKEKVDELYLHQEKLCFGNSPFSTIKKVDKGSYLCNPDIWPNIKELQLEVCIKQGIFQVSDYPDAQNINSLENSRYLLSQQTSSEWMLTLFFFTGVEQINNMFLISYFSEQETC